MTSSLPSTSKALAEHLIKIRKLMSERQAQSIGTAQACTNALATARSE
jgi:hypothetical protein